MTLCTLLFLQVPTGSLLEITEPLSLARTSIDLNVFTKYVIKKIM